MGLRGWGGDCLSTPWSEHYTAALTRRSWGGHPPPLRRRRGAALIRAPHRFQHLRTGFGLSDPGRDNPPSSHISAQVSASGHIRQPACACGSAQAADLAGAVGWMGAAYAADSDTPVEPRSAPCAVLDPPVQLLHPSLVPAPSELGALPPVYMKEPSVRQTTTMVAQRGGFTRSKLDIQSLAAKSLAANEASSATRAPIKSRALSIQRERGRIHPRSQPSLGDSKRPATSGCRRLVGRPRDARKHDDVKPDPRPSRKPGRAADARIWWQS